MNIFTLKRTARRLSKVLDCYVSIDIIFSVYENTRDKLDYSFYVEHESHKVFPTAQELNAAMNERIRKAVAGPKADEFDGEV